MARGRTGTAWRHRRRTRSSGNDDTGLEISGNAKLWERARDIGRVIDELLVDPAFKDRIDPERIAVIGHSMGGYTAMAVAGARLDLDLAQKDCMDHPELAVCDWYRHHGAEATPELAAAYGQDLTDPRVKAVVSLDLGFVGALAPSSLRAISIPVLVMAAGSPNPQLPAQLESRRLVAMLPPATTSYVEIPDASHFSFMGACQPGGYEILKAEEPDDAVFCLDGVGGTRSRAELHDAMLADITAFLARNGIM
jgi:predicted dienelactone hydrolase